MDANWKLEPEKYFGTLWNYFEDRYIDVQGVKTRYWSEGSGDTAVLLVHAYGGSIEEWAWNIPALMKNYRVVALDLPGFGLTDKPDAAYTYEYFAAFVDAFMEAMNIPKAHIIGHSMGGAISLNLALRHPGRARSLTLIAPAFGKKYHFGLHLLTTPFLGEKLFQPAASLADVAAGFRSLTHDEVRYPGFMLERYFRYQREPGYARANLRYMRNYLTPFGMTSRTRKLEKFYRENIPRLTVAVFLAWGPQDSVVNFSASKELLSLLPKAEFWCPAPCGHGPLFEYPEEFNARALEFLGRN